MDNGLKKRLIGATVLVSVAVILVPMFFDQGRGKSEEHVLVKLPPRPIFSKLEIASPARPEITVSPMTELLEPEVDDSTAESKMQSSLVDSKQQTLTENWVIQMGAFKKQKNAEILRDRLRAAKYKTYIQYRPDHMPVFYRVYVGPQLQRREIELLRDELLKRDYQLDDIKIVRYSPGLYE